MTELDEHVPTFAQLGTPAELPSTLEGVAGSEGYWFGVLKRAPEKPKRARAPQKAPVPRKRESRLREGGEPAAQSSCHCCRVPDCVPAGSKDADGMRAWLSQSRMCQNLELLSRPIV